VERASPSASRSSSLGLNRAPWDDARLTGRSSTRYLRRPPRGAREGVPPRRRRARLRASLHAIEPRIPGGARQSAACPRRSARSGSMVRDLRAAFEAGRACPPGIGASPVRAERKGVRPLFRKEDSPPFLRGGLRALLRRALSPRSSWSPDPGSRSRAGGRVASCRLVPRPRSGIRSSGR
jgi:hypothetical protein